MSDTTTVTFDIRNFLDCLEPGKEKHKYICPSCGGNDLGIDPTTGAYQCFHGCQCKQIREALKPWAEVMEERRSSGANTAQSFTSSNKKFETKTNSSRKKFDPIPLPDGNLAIPRLTEKPLDIPQAVKTPVFETMRTRLIEKGATPQEVNDTTVTTYDYGSNKFVYRYQCPSASSKKGHVKTFILSRVDEATGKTERKRGPYTWDAYRQAEAIAAMKAVENAIPVLLFQEGEKCVEFGRQERLVSISPQGTPKEEDLICNLNSIKTEMGSQLFIVAYLKDNDSTGDKKSERLSEVCARCQIPFVAIDLKGIKSDLIDGGDIADIIAGGMDGDQIAKLLLEEIEYIRLDQQGTADYEDEDDDDYKNEDLHPESHYRSACKALKLPFENCVTARSFDLWVYHTLFTGAANWRVFDSAFYRWSEINGVWEYQTDVVVMSLIADECDRAFKLSFKKEEGWLVNRPYGTDGHKKSAFGYAKSRLERPEDKLIANNHLLSFRNCTIDLRTGQQMPHDKNHLLTNLIPLDYNPNQPCPEIFRQFVADSFGDEMLEPIRAFTSMFLDPTAPFGRFPHLLGQSGGGKGTLGRFWNNLFGKSGSGSTNSFADLLPPEGRHQHLTGKKIFGFPDVGGHQQGVRAFYELVDNGDMTGRALFSPTGYSKEWYVRFWVASVDHLQVENAGDGWARRAYPLPVRSRDVKPDPELRHKLESVKADVISWALAMPRDERDRILLSPPDTERAINTQMDAALYGDSTKSFVDLCLRPTTEQVNVPHHLLHTWYVSYCREHGYTPLGMSKFISHLKTILPRHFIDRSWSPMVDGKRDRVPAHWENICSLPGAFVSWVTGGDSGESSNRPVTEEWACVKRNCQEGGLEELDDFWNPPTEPEPKTSEGTQGQQQSTAPVEPQETVDQNGNQETIAEDEWSDPQTISDMAVDLASCEDPETLAYLRQCYPPAALKLAVKMLDIDKRKQIHDWVIQQNAGTESTKQDYD